ncbi:MAG: hypothetical protein WCO35_00195 [Candidatus Nomurabacteria bacterium]
MEKQKASIKSLIEANPSGLLEMQKPLSPEEYRNNYGFKLKNTVEIFESKRLRLSGNDEYKFPGHNSLEELFKVEEESTGDLLVVFIAEVIMLGKIHLFLILKDAAFKKMIEDKSQEVIKVHQMYTKFWKDHIALNMNIPQIC